VEGGKEWPSAHRRIWIPPPQESEEREGSEEQGGRSAWRRGEGGRSALAASMVTWRRCGVIPDFKDKTRYTPYVSLRSQISHIATNKG